MSQPPTRRPAEILLDAMVEKRWLELEEGSDRATLVAGIERALASGEGPRESAEAIASWLLEQRSVAELYASDEDLAKLLQGPG